MQWQFETQIASELLIWGPPDVLGIIVQITDHFWKWLESIYDRLVEIWQTGASQTKTTEYLYFWFMCDDVKTTTVTRFTKIE